jgi:hypothetical protein
MEVIKFIEVISTVICPIFGALLPLYKFIKKTFLSLMNKTYYHSAA